MTGSAARAAARRAHRALQRTYATDAVRQADATRLSKLTCGVRVVTGGLHGRFPAVGLYVDTGSRYETATTLGCTQLLDKLAFQGTQTRSTAEISQQLIDLGGHFFHAAQRDGALFQALVTDGDVSGATDLLIDSAFAPLFDHQLIEQQKSAALYDNQMLREKAENWVPETIHEVAWQGNTLGHPLPAPEANLVALTPDILARFHRTWYRPERIVVAGVGVDHDTFVDLVNRQVDRYLPALRTSISAAAASAAAAPRGPSKQNISRQFSTTPTAHATATDEVDAVSGEPSVTQVAAQRAHYTGGEQLIEAADAKFTRLILAYEGVALHDPDIYPLAVLHAMLGGGASFSSGGPGKGMFSRFYTNVLARHHLVEHCSALHNIFADSGIFGVHIAVDHEYAHRAGPIAAEGLASCLVNPLWLPSRRNAEIELARARNALQMNLMQALESRLVQVEDLGRQVQQMGRHEPEDELCAKIQAVSLRDVVRVAERVLTHGKPSILGHGHVGRVGDLRSILRAKGLSGR